MLHHVPSPLPLTLLMASDPEFLGAGLDPYRKLTGAKNSAQRTNRVLQASIHDTMHGGDTVSQGSQVGEPRVQT